MKKSLLICIVYCLLLLNVSSIYSADGDNKTNKEFPKISKQTEYYVHSYPMTSLHDYQPLVALPLGTAVACTLLCYEITKERVFAYAKGIWSANVLCAVAFLGGRARQKDLDQLKEVLLDDEPHRKI